MILYQDLYTFRELANHWLKAVLLPVDQIILTLAQDIFTEPGDLALAHKLAATLRRAADANPSWRLAELSDELGVIARNERRFIGFSEEESGFDPDQYKGRVVVATMHKAKGLEWDRVYLMSINNYDFPSGMPYDTYISEKYFIRNSLNLPAEALSQLDVAISNNPYEWYEEGQATLQSRYDYIRERMRLLYVGITRARRELLITWNTGRDGRHQPAIPLVDLQEFLKRQSS